MMGSCLADAAVTIVAAVAKRIELLDPELVGFGLESPLVAFLLERLDRAALRGKVGSVGLPIFNGETVVKLKPGAAATEAELREFLRGRLAAYKLPKKVVFVDQLPKNTAGKLLSSWGGPGTGTWLGREHGIFADAKGFIWVGGRAGWPRATTPGVSDDGAFESDDEIHGALHLLLRVS